MMSPNSEANIVLAFLIACLFAGYFCKNANSSFSGIFIEASTAYLES
jgi:hypothetical protein